MSKFVRRLALMAGLAGMVTALSGFASQEESYLLGAVNRLRASHGITELREDEELNDRAQSWAGTLAASGGLRHSRLETLPVPFSRAAENVAYGSTVEQVHGLLAASALHRQIMLDPAYTGVGIGTVRAPNGLLFAVEVFFAA